MRKFNYNKFIYISLQILIIFFIYNLASSLETVTPYENADPIDQALQKLNLTREKATFFSYTFNRSFFTEEVPELFLRYVYNPFKTPYYLAHFKQNFIDYENSLHDTLMYMTAVTGEGVSRGYKSEPLKPFEELSLENNGLYKSIQTIFNEEKVTTLDRKLLDAEVSKIPYEIKQPLAFLIYICAESNYWRNKSLRKCNKENIDMLFNNAHKVYFEMRKYIDIIEDELKNFDFKNFYCGGLDLATAVEKLSESIRKYKSSDTKRKSFSFSFETPYGLISVCDDGDSTYTRDKNYFILIDLSGNDFYENAAFISSMKQPCSILLDYAGNDNYGRENATSEFINSFASSIFGYTFLWDFSGNDNYYGSSLSQASSFFGVSVLIDEKGNENYNSKNLSQACAMFGLSLLIDKEGNDIYKSINLSQAFGYTKGYALLADYSGDDKYICDDEIISFPSAQSKKHNQSLSQGCGMGYRGDLGDGHSLQGGTGRLWDMSGNDYYSAGVFAQGCGFWSGIGTLVDSKGDDVYIAAYYSQGAGAHTAAGILMDEEGNDRYKTYEYLSLGSGHDFTLGFFIDKEGNDIYEFPSASLGSGKDNGIGIFMDLKGDDKYIYLDDGIWTLGAYSNSKLGTLREDMFSLGFFMDAYGDDKYVKKNNSINKNNSIWTTPLISSEYDLPFQNGIGIDGNFKKINLLLNVITKSNE